MWDLLPPDIAGLSWLQIILLSLTTSLILWAGSTPLQFFLPIVSVCIIAFGFHGSVPYLTRMYRGDNHRAVLRSLYYGFAVSLTVYAFWLTLTMGALTPQAIRHVSDEGGNIGAFITTLNIHRTTSAASLILVVGVLPFYMSQTIKWGSV
ncbi:hypothetical protein M8R21_47540 [Klebsiella sp. T2.Ur]|nr:hypothetical protein [Klebsiella sp. T2.Ur]